MFRIGEFSKLTQVTIRMLRYYDEMGLLKPARVDPESGYRLYSVEQIPVLNRIVYLRDSGFQVSEIAAALKSQDDAELVALLDQKHREVEEAIRGQQEKLRKIQLAKQEILQEKSQLHDQVAIKSVPACQVLSLRRVLPDYYAEGALWQELSAFASRHGIAASSHTFSLYHDADYREQDVDVELCVPVSTVGTDGEGCTFRVTEAVPLMACTMVYGPFSNIAAAYRTFARWLQKNSRYRMTGPNRQIVHRGPWNEEDPQRYLVEIQIPLEEQKFGS